MVMNIRKKDIFTVVESIPKWFAASDQITRPNGVVTCTDDAIQTLGNPLDCTTIGETAGTSPRDQISSRPELEHGPELANWPESVTGPLS